MNNWLKKLKKKAILPAAAFLVAAAAIGTTFAWQQWDLSITNNLIAHNVSVEQDESFDPESGTKEVKFLNNSNSSVFLRVSYSEYWIKGETDPNNKDFSNKNQGPNWGSKEKPTDILSNIYDGREIAVKDWDDTWPTGSAPCKTDDWFKAKDGWYYYKHILPAGGNNTIILHNVNFPASNLMPAGYDNTNYRLFFKAEVVQCSDGSNTLNSDIVNKKATGEIFKREVKTVNGNNVTWEGEPE